MIILLSILKMLGLTILQNASFTWVSRARNGKSYKKHAIAAVGSNGLYILVLSNVVSHMNTWYLMLTYVVGTVVGSVSMHFISMNYLEKDGVKWKDAWNDLKGLFTKKVKTSEVKPIIRGQRFA